ncbi:VOC family protein [Trinickia sp. LjRoot230]|uniref:VOC family protein n=1 Tax=Trinickia sp. LjRoot230 TaxID=3342288 RepID=UPI003ECD519E
MTTVAGARIVRLAAGAVQPDSSGGNVHCERITLRSAVPHQTADHLRALFGLEARRASNLADDGVEFAIGNTRLTIEDAAAQMNGCGAGVEVAVHDIAIATDDFDETYRKARCYGATVLQEPHGNEIRMARLQPIGLPPHTLIQRRPPTSANSSAPCECGAIAIDAVLSSVDHVAFCLPLHQLDVAAEFLRSAFGFSTVYVDIIETGGFGLATRVLRSRNGAITYVLNSALPHSRHSHIDAFVDKHGAGVQHIAFGVSDIYGFARRLRGTAFHFLRPPEEVYVSMARRLTDVSALPMASESSVMLDEDGDGQLAQAFVTPFGGDTASLFFEFIERKGSQGFGAGNIKDLFSAAENKMRAANAVPNVPNVPPRATSPLAPSSMTVR